MDLQNLNLRELLALYIRKDPRDFIDRMLALVDQLSPEQRESVTMTTKQGIISLLLNDKNKVEQKSQELDEIMSQIEQVDL